MAKDSYSASIPQQAYYLLRLIREQFPRIAKMQGLYNVYRAEQISAPMTSADDFQRVLDYMIGKNWIGRSESGYYITDIGYDHLEKDTPNTGQAFVAMWFSDSMNEIYKKGIAPAIENSGYNPLRIDRKDFLGRIDDEIIAEIRRSIFVVADFSHGDGGVRGSVYYEAGFAHGLDIPVIYLCRKGSDLAFDTNHYPHIIWETPEELRTQLSNRIWALIGQGPTTSPLQ